MVNENIQITIQNRLTALSKHQAMHIARRTIDNQEHPFPKVISSMEGCFDIQMMIYASKSEGFDIVSYGVESLEEVLKTASYSQIESKQVVNEYLQMKKLIFDLLFNNKSSNSHLLRQFEHDLYKTHICSKECNVTVYKKCPNYNICRSLNQEQLFQ